MVAPAALFLPLASAKSCIFEHLSLGSPVADGPLRGKSAPELWQTLEPPTPTPFRARHCLDTPSTETSGDFGLSPKEHPEDGSKQTAQKMRRVNIRPPGSRLAMLVSGSRGDVQPLLALAKQLQGRHQVRLLTNTNHADLCQRHGIQMVPVFADSQACMERIGGVAGQGLTASLRCVFQGQKAAKQWLSEHPEECTAVEDALDEFRPDAVLTSNEALPLGIRYETATGVPCVYACYFREMLNFNRSIFEMTPPRPIFLASSPLLEEVPSCPQLTHVGPWLLEDMPTKEDLEGPLAQLQQFLAASNAPPVAVCWGSMIPEGMEPLQMLRLILNSVAPRRAVVVGGYAKLHELGLRIQRGEDLVSREEAEYARCDCCFVEDVSHEWLLPQCMCLVHHGGAGTLQRALAAGIPSVVTPIFADQFDNANAVTRLGAGVGFTKPLQQVTADSLARAIAAAETYRGNCANLAAELSQDGATQAAGVLDTFLREVSSGFAEVSDASLTAPAPEPRAPGPRLGPTAIDPMSLVLPAPRERLLAEDRGDQIRGLPAGWVPCRTEEGEVYYHQPSLGKSQWRHPAAAVEAAVKKQCSAWGAAMTGKEEEIPAVHSVYDARSRHVDLPTPNTLFTDCVQVVREDLTGRAFALHGLLSTEEAACYTEAARARGFDQSDVAREFPSYMRNNSRLIHFSDALAGALYRRLAPQLKHRDIYLLQPMGFGAEGRWKPTQVNPCFRISQYKEGEHFAPHCDGMYANDADECSIYSLVLYLNDNFEGGELAFEDGTSFVPRAGSAVLFPHDLKHSAEAVTHGAKYVARSELMFRCIDRRPAPSKPQYAEDPLFQKMAALYEHIGDLAAFGDAEATTSAYQEALGIQIAHQGTEVKTSRSRLGLEDKTWETVMSYLEPFEVCGLFAVSVRWRAISCGGALWRDFFRRRWTTSELMQGDAYDLDPELTDWLGLYRQQHLLTTQAPVAVLFLGSCLQSCHFDPVPAVAEHDNTGVGWDRSFKQRAGWDLLGAGKRPGFGLERRSWFQKEVDFEVLPEIFACAFRKLPWLASEQHLVVPMVPGVTSVAYDRLAKILHRRFQVPRLSLVSAPLCALAAHELRSGAVVFGSDLGTSAIFCYQERVVVAELGPFDFFKATTHQIADLLAQAKTQLQGFPDVLQHVVLSSQPFLQVAERSRLIDSQDFEVRKNFQGWAKPEELQRALKVAGLGATVHGPELRDVVRGAEVLAPELPEHVVPSLPQSWEWRVFAQGQWQPLPSYVAAVFEGAWRNRQTLATVQVMANSHAYLLADLEEWTVQCCKCCKPMRLRGMAGKTSKEDFKPQGSVSRLTRFLRGRPSADPDLRRPEDFDVTTSEVQQVSGGGALHVRSLSGKLVFSQRRPLELSAVLSRCAQQLKVDVERLRLLDGAEEVDEKRFRSLEEQEEQAIDLQLVVGPALPKKDKFQEQIPEELPGEKLGNSHPLLKAVRTALQLRGLA
ncbi:unnamed protein product [Effrenium voratum]|nr:unnamed protein product [Effrenium voratum]